MPDAPSPNPSPSGPAAGKGGLGQKVGPLPVWAWAGFIVGGVALVLLFRGAGAGDKKADVTSEDQQSLDTTSAADAARLAALANLFSPGGGSPGGNGSPSIGDPTIGVCPPGYINSGGLCVPGPVNDDTHVRGPLPPTRTPGPPADAIYGSRGQILDSDSTYWSPRVG